VVLANFVLKLDVRNMPLDFSVNHSGNSGTMLTMSLEALDMISTDLYLALSR
jgi:hypothetical protein